MKRKKNKNSFPARYLLLVLCGICLIVMFLAYSVGGTSGGPLNSVASYIFVPMQKGINYAGTWLSDKADNSGHMDYPVFAKQAIIHTVSLLKELYQHL